MADEWLPMRLDLWDDPRIVKLARELGSGRAAAVGACFRLWTLANRFTTDGKLSSYDAPTLDTSVEIKGFTAVMESVGWLVIGADGVCVPDFEKWGSQGAKRRLKDNQRKSTVRKMSASRADTSRTKTGPEKKTEEKKTEDRGTVPFRQSFRGVQGGDSDDEWEQVVGEVFDMRVNDAAAAVDEARRRGATPADVRELVAFWAEEPERWSNPHATLHRRLMRFSPMQPPDTGWDAPSPEYVEAQRSAAAKARHHAQTQAQLTARKLSTEERDRCLAEYRERRESLADEYRKNLGHGGAS